jgi:hypothetical protein
MLNMSLKSHFICNFRFNYYQHADEILNGLSDNRNLLEIVWYFVNDLKSDIDLILLLLLMRDEICPFSNYWQFFF